MNSIDYMNDPRAVLIHFNPNHDKLGRFSKSNSAIQNKIKKKWYKSYTKAEAQFKSEKDRLDSISHLFDSNKGLRFWIIEERRRAFNDIYKKQLAKDLRIDENDANLKTAPNLTADSSLEFLKSLKQPPDELFRLLPRTYAFVKGSNNDEAKVASKKLKEAIRDGHVRVDDTMDNLQNMQYMQIINDQQIMNQQIQNQLLTQQAIQEANRCASLSMTMGMNPFMFG